MDGLVDGRVHKWVAGGIHEQTDKCFGWQKSWIGEDLK